MSESALIGIDFGKHNFHLHGQNKSGREVFRKNSHERKRCSFRQRAELCCGDRACAGAHFVARQLAATHRQADLSVICSPLR